MLFLPSFLVLDAIGNHLGKVLCIFAQVLETNSEILDDIEIVTGAKEPSSFAIKQYTTDIGIVSENLSERRFPFISVAMCPKPEGYTLIGR